MKYQILKIIHQKFFSDIPLDVYVQAINDVDVHIELYSNHLGD